jgi:hypothetical protein
MAPLAASGAQTSIRHPRPFYVFWTRRLTYHVVEYGRRASFGSVLRVPLIEEGRGGAALARHGDNFNTTGFPLKYHLAKGLN